MLKVTETETNRFSEIPSIFTSIGEAHDFFEYLLGTFYYEFNEIMNLNMSPAVSDVCDNVVRRYESLLKRWSDALYRFEQCRDRLITHKERIGLKILRIHQQYVQFVLLDHHNTGRTDQSSWDKYNSIFEDIVSQASAVLDMTDDTALFSPSSLSSDGIREGRLRPSFSLNVGIITTLYDIATLCRDPAIRRRAVNVLRSASRQEGLLNSHVCAVVAEKVIALEEVIALRGGLDGPQSFTSIMPFFLESEQQQLLVRAPQQKLIRRSFEVPDTARLPLAYPSFDTVNKKAFLTIGDAREMPVKIPLPAMTAMLDMER